MTWTINFILAIILTTLTGSLMTLIWFLIGELFERTGFMNIRHILLKGVIMFYLVPVVYITLKVYTGMSIMIDARFFASTPIIFVICLVLLIAWLSGVVLHGRKYFREVKRNIGITKTLLPCRKEVQEHFEQICDELNISVRSVSLFQSYYAAGPIITGVIRPKIIIPVDTYTNEELRVAFMHELTHYKQGDLLAKSAMSIIKILHFFNPAAKWLDDLIDRWTEYACDYNVVSKVGGMKSYFGIIVNIMREDRNDVFGLNLVEDEDKLEERVKHMKKYYKIKTYSKWVAVMIFCAMIIVSTSSVYASTNMLAKGYIDLYESTVIDSVENAEEVDESIEYYETGGLEGINIVTGELKSNIRSVYAFEWTVPKNTMYKTNGVSVSSGDSIVVTVVANPSDKVIKVGILQPDGSRRYVQGSDTIYHSFEITQSGTHNVFVLNENSVSVEVSGSYIVN